MSRLLNNFKTRLWQQSPGVIGLAVRNSSVVAARALKMSDGFCLTDIIEEEFPFPLFTNAEPRKDDCAGLVQAMQKIASLIPQTYWPLQIALPAPAAIFQVMEFESIPPTKDERSAIAKFRLGKEFPAMPLMQCSTQVISKEGEQGLLMALFVRGAWLDCVKEACRAAGFVPCVVDMSVNYLFNVFHDVIQMTLNDGVLISIEPDCWSILFWDAAHRPRFVKSRWRDSQTELDVEYEEIVKDVERLIMSYVLSEYGRKIDSVFLCANAEDRTALASRIDKRMRMPSTHLDAVEKFSIATGCSVQSISPALLAAALPRR